MPAPKGVQPKPMREPDTTTVARLVGTYARGQAVWGGSYWASTTAPVGTFATRDRQASMRPRPTVRRKAVITGP